MVPIDCCEVDLRRAYEVLGEQVVEQRAVLGEKPHEIVTLCLEVRILLEKHVCLLSLLLNGLDVWRKKAYQGIFLSLLLRECGSLVQKWIV